MEKEELDERTNDDNLACARLGRPFKLQLFERRMLRFACFTARYVIHHAYKTYKLTCLENTSVSAAIVPCARTCTATRFSHRVYDYFFSMRSFKERAIATRSSLDALLLDGLT